MPRPSGIAASVRRAGRAPVPLRARIALLRRISTDRDRGSMSGLDAAALRTCDAFGQPSSKVGATPGEALPGLVAQPKAGVRWRGNSASHLDASIWITGRPANEMS